ncbi:ABC transporter substrate-binding protein [Saccharibacillus alkalitolerans]|uniref:Extracellular solute-binding protein n=1 Tax=Saccharibacillus alkalitolerans TaxID=2705290 RepID=A0ABX0F2H5_9BACL|nr:extracellular solute-binding protein [Saccharibacillus alkalitolerans]NGZ73863.1 extracellular solute-binding protein [Saccharibacillus alkalitolerans]
MKRKNHFVLFGILLLALINLSPSLPETSPPGPQKDRAEEASAFRGGESERPLRDIEVHTMMEAEEFKALQSVSEEYERRSGSRVILKNVAPEQAYKAYRAAYSAGNEPDVLMLDGSWVADFAASGRLLPADLYEAGVASASDSLPISAASVEWNGYRWAVPLDFDPYGAAWNPERFKATSGELPQTEEAWNDWEADVPKAEKAGMPKAASPISKEVVGLPAGDIRAFAALIALWKGSADSEDAERVSRALTLADDLRSRTYLNPLSTRDGHSSASLRARVESRELDLAVDRLSRLGAEDSSSSRVIPLPSAARTAALRCFGITANTRHSREASLWISFMTGRETQSAWYESTGHLPVLRVVYQEPESAGLLRWLPQSQTERPAPGSGVPNPKKVAKHEISLNRSLERFYEGKLGADKFAAYLMP